jgi:hypothetical protein
LKTVRSPLATPRFCVIYIKEAKFELLFLLFPARLSKAKKAKKNTKKEEIAKKEIKNKSGLDIIKEALNKSNKNIKNKLLDILNGK